jgi:hypothetical protein
MDDALRVGKYLKENLRPETLVLLKSSYGGIWLEEAIKPILKDPRDAKKLSRQFEPWITYKRKTFGRNWRP